MAHVSVRCHSTAGIVSDDGMTRPAAAGAVFNLFRHTRGIFKYVKYLSWQHKTARGFLYRERTQSLQVTIKTIPFGSLVVRVARSSV